MTILKRSGTVLLTVLPLFLPSVVAAQLVQEPLASVRERITFPELSDADKRVIAEQAQIFLRDLYVHRFDKLDFYPGLRDPVPAIQDVLDNLDGLNTAELEEAIYRIFVEQRDLHLNYIFPSPHANYRSFLPLTFARTAGRRSFFEVRVGSVNEELFERFAPGERVPEVGDRVVAYDGLPIRAAVRRQLKTAQGANRFGGFTRALAQMTFVPHNLHLVPPGDAVHITLRSSDRRGGRRYSIMLPWVSEFPDPALETMSGATSRATSWSDRLKELERGQDLWQAMFNEFLANNNLRPVNTYPENPSEEPELTWGIIDNPFGRFGYLRLNSFIPENGTDFALEEIRRLIFTEFQGSDGLIFDVRGNGGGSIIFADRLSQLFIPNAAQTIDARLLNNDLNRRILNETLLGFFSLPIWREVINDAEGTGMVYTAPGFFTTDERANELGQVYYKPVAVLADARSYSAADLFVCAMKDNAAALMYGEDPRTGAGGANVITHSLFSLSLSEVFEPLPLDHAMRVSWRQLLRFGPSEGRIIEDFGCEADIDVSQTKADLLSGGETQIRTITRSLARRSRTRKYRSSPRPLQNRLRILTSRTDSSYDLLVRNTPFVNVLVNGELFEQKAVFAGPRESQVTVALPSSLPVGEVTDFVLEGRSRRQELLWNVKRQIVGLNDQLFVDAEGVEVNFETSTSTTAITVLNPNRPEAGWNFVPPNLEIGYTPTYLDRLDSDAILLVDLTHAPSAHLEFDLKFDTELDADFIEVYVEDRAEKRVTLLRESGRRPLSHYSFDISEYTGQDNVQLHFRFTSDSSGVAPGVRLRRISVTE